MKNAQSEDIATSTKEALLKAIYVELENAYEDTLEEILELLKIRRSEDEEDIKEYHAALEDIKTNGTIPWLQAKREIA
ncbi:hypothetical protein [Cylindrospermum sp. FACHB-282]|uniref:hypothetical protein n=1 Tax=Cylindrospermum sp. FACHB-282 TaxID=2692794 RepID=UPI00168369EC|nr:hypothetical protein [Cylindrospermum sp. FACHB-282]MBD2385569.1 hypothetical protein [Cylindrospermum sp. FACHB-282]